MDGKLVNQTPSIADVAQAAGVSKATVSNWLNGHLAKVSPETRSRLTAVAERLGYRPMLGARRLSSRTPSGTVGLVVRRDLARVFADPYVGRVMEGVGPVFSASATRSLVITSPGPGEDTDYLLSLARGIVDGFLVFDIEDHDRTLEALVRHDVPFVAVGQPQDEAPFPWVATDHAAAVSEAVTWLASQGHTHIALRSGPSSLLIHRHRRRGYLEALATLGLTPDPVHPTAVLRETRDPESELGAAAVFLDGPGPQPGAWIEAPSPLVGRRAAQMLEQRMTGSSPAPELHAALFHCFPKE